MDSYKEYLKACQIKKQWEENRSKLQAERAKRKQIIDYDNLPDQYINQLKYIINGLSYKIAKEEIIMKSKKFFEKAKISSVFIDMYNDRINELKNERQRLRNNLIIELKKSKSA